MMMMMMMMMVVVVVVVVIVITMIRTAPCRVMIMMMMMMMVVVVVVVMVVIVMMRTAPDSIGMYSAVIIQNHGYSQCTHLGVTISMSLFPVVFPLPHHYLPTPNLPRF